ncbi:MAG: glutaredoxin family protein [Bacteroidota bacterium]|nr:glutaredoxin family protein [Bacteroidota bacterium]
MPKITLYSTPWCGDCRNAKRFLKEAGIAYDEIDIDQNEQAAQQVIDWSGGRRVIPTFHIVTGDAQQPLILHNPPIQKLAAVLGIQ